MKCLFFISLLAVAAATTINLPLKKLLANPKLFAAAFAHADNDAVSKMISLVNALLVEGEDERNAAIDDHGVKTDTHDADVDSLASAIDGLGVASGNLDVAASKRDVLVAAEDGDRNSLNAAVGVLEAATSLDALTEAHLASTTARVAEEKEGLEQVKVLLESVSAAPEGRRLLSIDTADPDAVAKVIAKVDALLATGAKEEEESTAAHDAAHEALDAAIAAEKAARDKHQATAGELAAAEQAVTSLTAVKNTKTSEKNSAVAAEEDSANALAAALKWMDGENARVDAEKATLEEVNELLNGILSE